jgi:hypothetical protein
MLLSFVSIVHFYNADVQKSMPDNLIIFHFWGLSITVYLPVLDTQSFSHYAHTHSAIFQSIEICDTGEKNNEEENDGFAGAYTRWEMSPAPAGRHSLTGADGGGARL